MRLEDAVVALKVRRNKIIEAIRAVHRTVSAKAPARKEGEAAPAWTRIGNVAVFAHGMHGGMSLDKDNSHSKGLQLFACNAAREIDYLEERRNIKGKTPEKAIDESTYREWTVNPPRPGATAPAKTHSPTNSPTPALSHTTSG